MSWHIPPGQFRGIAGLDLRALGIPTEASTCAATASAPAEARIDPAHWNFYLAYNLFRIAAILQGIAKRVVDGTASSAAGASTPARARGRMAELGWQWSESTRKSLRRAAWTSTTRRRCRSCASSSRVHGRAHLSQRAQVARAHVRASKRWEPLPMIEELKPKARAAGLWNLCRPKSHGGTLTNLEYAPLGEIMGRVPWAPRSSTARRPTPATWRRCCVRHARADQAVARAAARRQDPLGLRDDRAGRRLVGRDQHRDAASCARATTT